MGIIKAVKRGDTGAEQRQALKSAAENLRGRSADLLLIACTELSVLADCLADFAHCTDRRLPVLDALDVLAEKIVACGGASHG